MLPIAKRIMLFLLIVAPALAQRGAISGVVLDPAGARITRATIHLINTSTNHSMRTASNDEGLFRFADLLPGPYRVSAVQSGFRESTLEVVLSVEERKGVTFVLDIEGPDQSIAVQSSVSSLQNEGGGVSTLVSQELAHNLPVNGRNFQTLLDLTPGLVLTPAGTQDHGQFSVNGQRANANYLTVDGVSANVGVRTPEYGHQELNGSLPSTGMAGGSQGVVSVEDVQEFRVQTSSFAPEFGRTPGAQIQVSTRSGTNSFHGSLYDYFRNDAMDARDWFVNAQRLPNPPLRQHDFGGAFGGPLIKDRLLFFGSIESLHLTQPRNATLTVPTDAMRNSAGNAIAERLFKAYPLPNQPGQTSTSGQFASSYGNPTRSDLFSFRSDYLTNERVHSFFRVSRAPGNGYNGLGISRAKYNVLNTTITAGATFIIGPSVSNDLRLNYSSASRGYGPAPKLLNGARELESNKIIPSFDSSTQWVNFVLGVYSPLAEGTRSANTQRQFNVVDSIDVIVGKHQLKFGFDMRALRPQVLPGSLVGVVFQNLDQINAGVAANVQRQQNAENITIRYGNYSLYGQDAWRINSRLGITWGLRWEINPPPSDSAGGPPAIVGVVGNPNATQIVLKNHKPFPTQWNAFAPRLGAAWNFRSNGAIQLTLRGGVGVFYDLSPSGAVGSTGALSSEQAFNVVLSNYQFPAPSGTVLPLSSLFVADPAVRLPRTVQYSATIEAGLWGANHLTIGYLGALGQDLIRNHSYTGLKNPTTSYLAVYQSDGESNYNAMQLQFRRSASQWLEALASYTFAKSIDNASNEVTIPEISLSSSKNERGLSNFDIRHQVAVGLVFQVPPGRLPQSGWSGVLLRGWSVSPFLRLRSGLPLTVLSGGSQFAGNSNSTPRANLVAGQPIWVSDPNAPKGLKLNYAAFSNPAPNIQGNLGRNAIEGFGLAQMDVNVSRSFKFTEKIFVRLSMEAFNVTNHPNFGPVRTSLRIPSTFGTATSLFSDSLGSGALNGGLNSVYQTGGSRSMQISARLSF